MRSRLMAELTWQDVKDAIAGGAGVILPVGSLEQHGFHLPLSTDSILATTLAEAVADDCDMVVAPVFSYGYRSRPATGGGQTFVGTTSLSGVSLMNLVQDVLSEFIRQGFRRIVILNWHMENQSFLYEAAYRVMETVNNQEVKMVIMESSFESLKQETMEVLFDGEFPGWGIEHASIFETSLMLYLHPDRVRMERAVDDRAERYPWYDVLPIPDDMVAPSGTLWRATRASREKGALAWPEVVAQVKAAILTDLPR